MRLLDLFSSQNSQILTIETKNIKSRLHFVPFLLNFCGAPCYTVDCGQLKAIDSRIHDLCLPKHSIRQLHVKGPLLWNNLLWRSS